MYSRLLQERIVFLNGPVSLLSGLTSLAVSERTYIVTTRAYTHTLYGDQIDDALSSVVVAQLLFLEAESTSPISLYINSPGGSVTAGLAIYDTVILLPSSDTFQINHWSLS